MAFVSTDEKENEVLRLPFTKVAKNINEVTTLELVKPVIRKDKIHAEDLIDLLDVLKQIDFAVD